MGKKLILAEKPSVGRDIAKVLGCNQQKNGVLEGDKYIVTWALGHLITLADPERYERKYATWQLEDLPLLPKPLKLEVMKGTRKQFQLVKNALERKDVTEVIIATDAGREGELVARWILDYCRNKKKVSRLWISSVTDKAIKQGFQSLKNGNEFINLYHAAVARAEADWYVGINGTRALTCKHNTPLSCGRVQTPTLAMIASKEEDIKHFTPKNYFGLQVKIEGHDFTWRDEKNSSSTFHEDKIDTILNKVKNQQAKIVSVKRKEKSQHAPLLYDLTDLQREANSSFGFSAKETLNIMQKLYEQHKIVTYPRTNSRYLSSDMVSTLLERVEAISIKPYTAYAQKVKTKGIEKKLFFIDDKKVTDHHAIVPTEQTPVLSSLSDKERKIYDLIVKRFLAVLLPATRYEEQEIIANISSETFVLKKSTTIELGWKELYGEKKEAFELHFLENKSHRIGNVKKTTGVTQPPPRFTEGTLLAAMENPSKYMNSAEKELVKSLNEAGGIGTVATRADIIEKLLKSFLIEKKGQFLYVTGKGRQLLELVPEELKSPLLTAEWELKLQLISDGKLKKEQFLDEMRRYANEIVKEVKSETKVFKHENITGTRCPNCEKFMLEVNGKHGKMYVCQDRECNTKKTISRTTNARCPQCKKKLELRGEGDGQIFTCKCGYREKLSHFQDRRSKEKSGKVSKQDMKKYMKQQEEPVNTALADALSQLFKK